MARFFRIWEKKRGDRRTGSQMLGGLGEAVFFGILFLLGCLSLAHMISSQVLNPDPRFFAPGLGYWLLVLVLASFILIGGGGLVFTVLRLRVSLERRSALAKQAAGLDLLGTSMASGRNHPYIPRDANLTNSPGTTLAYRLPSMESPAWQLLAASLFCLVWTGITIILTVVAFNGHRAGQPDWPLTLFVIPVAGVCGWACYYFWQRMRLHAGIGPTSVEISDHPLYPGQEYQLSVSQSGRLDIRQLNVFLVCEEQATYRQGTDIRTEVHRVFRQKIFGREGVHIDNAKPLEHVCHIAIPLTAMHTFQASYNAVCWKIEVMGTAEGWPPFQRAFPIIVYPPIPPIATPDSASEDGSTSDGSTSEEGTSEEGDTDQGDTAQNAPAQHSALTDPP